MKKLIDRYNIAYHALPASMFFSSCKILEPDNKLKADKLYEIELNGFDGYSFPHNLASELSSFARASTTVNDTGGIKISEGKFSDGKTEHPLMKDCDGIILFEKEGQKYMLFCELKSGYSAVLKAKNQICASYIKMKALMGTLMDFDLRDYYPIGVIFSYKPNPEERNMNSKKFIKGMDFPAKLQKDRKVLLSKLENEQAFSPLKMDDIIIYYCEVPDNTHCFSVDINSIII